MGSISNIRIKKHRMPKGLIIISDSNQVGISHKLIVPTIKLLYLKRGYDCTVINLHQTGFDPMLPPSNIDSKNNAITKAYKHYFKTADQIHFISNKHTGGLSAGIEGFLEHVVTNGFAYQYDGTKLISRVKNKEVFFHVHNSYKNITKFDSIWFRIKLSKLPKLFKSCNIYQSDLSWANQKSKNKKIKKLRDTLIKKLFNE